VRGLAVIIALALTVAGTACSENETLPEDPAGIAAAWLHAVADVDTDVLSTAVDETTLGILLAVENAFDADQSRELLVNGPSDELRSSYWASFREAFTVYAGVAPNDLTVGTARNYVVDTAEFAVVPASAGGRSTDIILERTNERWRVDMVATMGPVMVRPIRSFVASIAGTADGTEVLEVMRETIPQSLQAALAEGRGELPEEYRRDAILLVAELGGP
jgi:hypothetical protein